MTYYEGPKVGRYSPSHYWGRADYLWEKMAGCACGNGREFAELAYEILLDSARDHDDRQLLDRLYEDQRLELLAHWMTGLDILEHGGQVHYSWLTDKGRKILEEINNLEEVAD